jgi:hypothetical protein
MTEQLAQCSVVTWLFFFFCLVVQQLPSKDNDEDLTWIVHGYDRTASPVFSGHMAIHFFLFSGPTVTLQR